MSSESKAIIDEIQKQSAEQNRVIEQRFLDNDTKWEQRLLEVEPAGMRVSPPWNRWRLLWRIGGRASTASSTISSWRFTGSPSTGSARCVRPHWWTQV